MTLPNQMTTHMLNANKNWPLPGPLDFSAPISGNVSFTVNAGRCVHLNSAIQFEPGAHQWQMPLFLFQNQSDPDVDNSNNGQWFPISPRGNAMALVAKGAYELFTTEFDTTQSYAPNQPLRAPVGNTTAGTGGLLTNQGVVDIGTFVAAYSASSTTTNYYTNVCGIVSSGTSQNAYGVLVLNFWPVWYPGHPSES